MGDDDEDEDCLDDDEDILVNHSSRCKLMFRTQDSPGSARPNRLGADLMAQMEGNKRTVPLTTSGFSVSSRDKRGETNFSIDFEEGTAWNGVSSEEVEQTAAAKPPIAPIGGPTLSSIAGRSLGFDLSGSLAAINKWVEDMDTGGSSDEEDDEEDEADGVAGDMKGEPIDNGSYSGTGASIATNNAAEPLSNIGFSKQQTGISREENDASSHGSRSLTSTSNSIGRSNREILSRKKILSMCVGEDEREADDSSIDNDILFFDVNNSSKLSYKNSVEHIQQKATDNSVKGGKGKSPMKTTSKSNTASRGSTDIQSKSSHRSRTIENPKPVEGSDADVRFSSRDEIDECDISDDEDAALASLYAENKLLTTSDSIAKRASSNSRGNDKEIRIAMSDNVPHSGGSVKAMRSLMASPRAKTLANDGLAAKVSSADLESPKMSSALKKVSVKSPDFEIQSKSHHSSPTDHTGENVAEQERHSANNALRKQPMPAIPSVENRSLGEGVGMKDSELVELLNRPPKTTYALRTKSNFQDFFRGMDQNRMKALLERAYSGEEDPGKKSHKVEKRMELLRDVLS